MIVIVIMMMRMKMRMMNMRRFVKVHKLVTDQWRKGLAKPFPSLFQWGR